MAVLDGELVGASRKPARRRREFHLNKSPTGPKFGGTRKVRRDGFQFEVALVQSDNEVAFEQFGVGRDFVARDEAVAIPINQREHLFRDGYTRREVDSQA